MLHCGRATLPLQREVTLVSILNLYLDWRCFPGFMQSHTQCLSDWQSLLPTPYPDTGIGVVLQAEWRTYPHWAPATGVHRTKDTHKLKNGIESD